MSGTSTPIVDDGGFGREFVDDKDDAGVASRTSTPVFDDGGFGREFVDEDANAEKAKQDVVDAGNQDGVKEPKSKQDVVDAGNQGEGGG